MEEIKEANIVEEINVNEILKVEQLPKVYEDLEKIGKYLDKNLEGIEDIECTEENKQEVKKRRTLINNTKTVLEGKRIEIKNIILEPYEAIETKYKDEIMNKITNAIATLDDKIAFIENRQKEEIKEKCERFFNEYALSKNIDFVTFENLNLKITLGLATEKGMLTKKTKDTIAVFIDKIVDDINLINSQKYIDEMMIEYKKDLNVSRAITDVNNRHAELERVKQEKEAKKEQEINDEVMLNKIDECLSAPKIEMDPKANEVQIPKVELLEMTFKVRGTREKLKTLKQFLDNGGFDYE